MSGKEARDPPRVLLVDDDPSVLRALRRGLADEFDVHTAESGREALKLIEVSEPFSVVLSDYLMPGMNGAEFLDQVLACSPHSARIMLTGSIESAPKFRSGATSDYTRPVQFFTKPFGLNDLRAALYAAIREHEFVGG